MPRVVFVVEGLATDFDVIEPVNPATLKKLMPMLTLKRLGNFIMKIKKNFAQF